MAEIDNLPYTKGIVNKIFQEAEKVTVEPIVSLSAPEFIAGAEYMKKEMLKAIKNTKF